MRRESIRITYRVPTAGVTIGQSRSTLFYQYRDVCIYIHKEIDTQLLTLYTIILYISIDLCIYTFKYLGMGVIPKGNGKPSVSNISTIR